MTWFHVILTVINGFNFYFLVVRPMSKYLGLWSDLYRYRSTLQFRVKVDMVGLPSMDEIRAGNLKSHRYVECRIDNSPTTYLVWKIWEDGTLVRHLDPTKTKWLNREHVVQYRRNNRPDDDPAVGGLFNRFEFLRYDVDKIWGLGFITRRVLAKITDEAYVMAKMGGIEVYDPLDLG